MKRRKNFLGGKKRYEMRVYVYGKRGAGRDRDRNIKVAAKSNDFRELLRGFKSGHLQYLGEYPYVEVYDTELGRSRHIGGTGRTFNPRKKKSTPKRRDVYAEMAKARKPTRGHKRKDRKRAVKRGSSRKPKHKLRLNPIKYEKPNTQQATFDAAVKKRQSKIIGIYRGFLSALEREGVKKLPTAGEIRDDAMRGAVLIESTRFPELRAQSEEAKGAKAVAEQVLGIGPGGEFAAYAQKYPEVFASQLKDITQELQKERKKLRSKQAKAGKQVQKAKRSALETQRAALEAKIAAKRARIASMGMGVEQDFDDAGGDEEGELDPQTAAELAEFYGGDLPDIPSAEEAEEEQLQEVAQREKAAKKARKKGKKKKEVEYVEGDYIPPTAGMSQEKLERLGKYVKHLSPVRRTDVQPPLKLLGDTRQDVLLYVLKDGTTQVWMKGSMTVTFEPSDRIPSWTIAHRYANRWRGLSPSGSVRRPKEGEPPVKKSRLRTAVYAAVEGENRLKKLEDPIKIVEKRDTKLKRKQYDMPDFDKYELIGDRANPRRRRNSNNFRTGPGPTWKEWNAGIRSALRSYGGGWPMSDFKAEMSRLYRRPADEVLKEGWRNGEDPEEFVSGVADSLGGEVPYPYHIIKNPKRRKNADAEILVLYGQGRRAKFGASDDPMPFKRRRRKNIMSSAGYDDDFGFYEAPRPRGRRERNKWSLRLTLDSFSKKYWGSGYKEVPRTIRMEFWDDFKYGYSGGFDRYKKETRG